MIKDLKLGQTIIVAASKAEVEKWAVEWVKINKSKLDPHDEYVVGVWLFYGEDFSDIKNKKDAFKILNEYVFGVDLGKRVERIVKTWAKQKGVDEEFFKRALKQSAPANIKDADSVHVRQELQKLFHEAIDDYYSRMN